MAGLPEREGFPSGSAMIHNDKPQKNSQMTRKVPVSILLGLFSLWLDGCLLGHRRMKNIKVMQFIHQFTLMFSPSTVFRFFRMPLISSSLLIRNSSGTVAAKHHRWPSQALEAAAI